MCWKLRVLYICTILLDVVVCKHSDHSRFSIGEHNIFYHFNLIALQYFLTCDKLFLVFELHIIYKLFNEVTERFTKCFRCTYLFKIVSIWSKASNELVIRLLSSCIDDRTDSTYRAIFNYKIASLILSTYYKIDCFPFYCLLQPM